MEPRTLGQERFYEPSTNTNEVQPREMTCALESVPKLSHGSPGCDNSRKGFVAETPALPSPLLHLSSLLWWPLTSSTTLHRSPARSTSPSPPHLLLEGPTLVQSFSAPDLSTALVHLTTPACTSIRQPAFLPSPTDDARHCGTSNTLHTRATLLRVTGQRRSPHSLQYLPFRTLCSARRCSQATTGERYRLLSRCTDRLHFCRYYKRRQQL